jgi:hypothetical protein
MGIGEIKPAPTAPLVYEAPASKPVISENNPFKQEMVVEQKHDTAITPAKQAHVQQQDGSSNQFGLPSNWESKLIKFDEIAGSFEHLAEEKYGKEVPW